jgi:pyruvate formate lyase activating enzyme
LSLISVPLASLITVKTPVYRGERNPTEWISNLPPKREMELREARYYRPVGNKVQCTICPKYCMLADGKLGACRVRLNKGRKLYTTVYGQPCGVALHPIEQGPVFHAYPGTLCLAIATAGCNLRCKYCQNWQMSQFSADETENWDLPPKRVIDLALKHSCGAIACTYTEPTVFLEYAIDTAVEARKRGLKTIFITAGFIDPEPMKEICRSFDVVRIDLKGFTEKFYKRVVGGRLKHVLMATQTAYRSGAWVEISVLLVPGYNDGEKEISQLCRWVRDNLSPDVPIHFLRFFPAYKMRNFPPTPKERLVSAREAAMGVGMKFVYIGNWPGNPAEHTYCPRCKNRLIGRIGHLGVSENNLVDGRCKFCGEPIPGRWA